MRDCLVLRLLSALNISLLRIDSVYSSDVSPLDSPVGTTGRLQVRAQSKEPRRLFVEAHPQNRNMSLLHERRDCTCIFLSCAKISLF